MNGVEAAASLFGSEESDSDLFATLGVDSTPNQFSPASLFPSHEPSSPHKSNLPLDTQFHSQPLETSTFGEYPAYSSQNHLFSGENDHAQGYNDNEKNIDDATYSNPVSPSLNPPPAEVSSQSYTPRSSLPQSNDSYLPPAIPATMNPVTTSAYSPYNIPSSNPPPATRIMQGPPMQVSSTQPYISQPATTPYLGASSLPMTPNTKPTVTRPKYSNAYDPPFIPSSSRRATRIGETHQAHNSYQQPSSPYMSATGASHVSDSYHSQNTLYHAENSHASSEISPNQILLAQPIYTNHMPATGESRVSGNYHPQTTLYHADKSHALSEIPPKQSHLAQSISANYMLATGASHVSGNYHPQNTSYHAENSQVLSEMPAKQNHLAQLNIIDSLATKNAHYAPSPSLLGSNDPLARTSARAPIVTFGFGGKMITCFHGMPGLNAGFDVALSSRTSSELRMRILHKLLPASVLNSPSSSYPGPLLSDPGTPSLSLVRPSLSAQMKAKRAAVVGYLDSRANEIDQGLGYLSNLEKQAAQGTLILVKLLKIMVENDGRLLGTPQAESSVRSALVPRLDGSATAIGGAVSIQAVYKGLAFDEPPLTVTILRPSALDKIQELLLLGDRRQAYQFAMDEKLWAHAMIIASSIDKDSWKEVVNDFLRTELEIKDDIGLPASTTFSSDPSVTRRGNWESLRVAYSLFSGQGAASVQELVPPNSLLQRATGGLQPLALSTAALPSPSFSSLQAPAPIPPESLSKWADTVAMMISSPLPSETSFALTAFGDQLLANNWVQAAHACYLLSPQTSLMGGLGSPSSRITLLGCKNLGDAMKDSDGLIFTEILEFAMSLAPVSKGQEVPHTLSYLQAYRFIRAVSLAESGYVQLAARYCEAISVSLNHTSPYTTNALLEQLQGLSQRLTGVHNDKAGSWIGGKLGKPSLDTIGGWLEGRFTKLVTGDSDTAVATEETKSRDRPFAGPFAHYSTISSTTPSARSSPQPSFTNLNMPPPRTSSAMATSSDYPRVPIERSSSALGYVPQKPGIHTSTLSFSSSQSSPTGFTAESHVRIHDPYGPKSQQSSIVDMTETPAQGTWWGSGADSNRTPTTATFMRIDESVTQPNADGFISLMDSHSFSLDPPQLNREKIGFSQQEVEVEDDDLGLRNSKPKPVELDSDPKLRASPTPVLESDPAAPPQPAQAQAPAGGGSWLGRWWKRSDGPTTTGPVKASLGEENTFYYDKEQKRWVNKKAGSEETPKPAPPPPPSRAQTASPGMSGSRASPPSGPPVRSASAIDLGSESVAKTPVRIRSNLAPLVEPVTPTEPRLNLAGPPPPASMPPPPGSTPPPGRPKSQAAKRNIRSRYVDVFQQEASGDT